jgi:hypothetical protein
MWTEAAAQAYNAYREGYEWKFSGFAKRDGYFASTLGGLWLSGPYLHNGAVPTIDDLLGDPEQRPKKFYLGSREYDPVKLGYKSDPIAGGFEFDTSIRGNSNRGHEFRKDYDKNKEIKGVIGPALSADDRKALIEYLKTL